MVVVTWVINSTNQPVHTLDSRAFTWTSVDADAHQIQPVTLRLHCNAQQCRLSSDNTLKEQTSHVLSSQTSSTLGSETWTMVTRANEAIVTESETSM